MTKPDHTLDDLLRIMERLRDPVDGCPWDLKQDFASIVPSTLEECYELAAAIEAEDFHHVADELGDVLFQVVFYAQLGRERDLFDFRGIVHGLASKLLRRHPHVFADGHIEGRVSERTDSEGVKRRWEEIKAEERADREQHGVLDDVPVALPALARAQKLQKRAARVGFDWQTSAAVLEKVDEELRELREAMEGGNPDAIADELGDLFFTLVNLTRHLQQDSETVLRRASSKFEGRFRTMEKLAAADGSALDSLDDDALDVLWNRAKAAS